MKAKLKACVLSVIVIVAMSLTVMVGAKTVTFTGDFTVDAGSFNIGGSTAFNKKTSHKMLVDVKKVHTKGNASMGIAKKRLNPLVDRYVVLQEVTFAPSAGLRYSFTLNDVSKGEKRYYIFSSDGDIKYTISKFSDTFDNTK